MQRAKEDNTTEDGKTATMSAITTHVLDISKGRPAVGIEVTLEFETLNGFDQLAKGVTNADGRVSDLLPKEHKLKSGIYRLTFETATYLAANNVSGFYPRVPILFEIKETEKHYHVPLLLSPFGYSTYRGS